MVPQRTGAIAVLMISIWISLFDHSLGFCCSKSSSSMHLLVAQSHVSSSVCRIPTDLNLYRKFHDYGWSKLIDRVEDNNNCVPDELRVNSSPVKGTLGATVVAKLRSTSQFPFLDSSTNVLRLARSAFLETQTAQGDALITPMTIHVFNFVIFPEPDIQIHHDESNQIEGDLVLPIFGADIVSLPGNKHLVVLDFQPVIPLNYDAEYLLPKRYSHIESKLKSIHSKYQHSINDVAPCLPWGGEIPSQAKRFFSPYALWSRLTDKNAINTVNTSVWSAFQEYFDLYLDLISAVQKDVSFHNKTTSAPASMSKTNQGKDGQIDYLEYRRLNDPARPMLQRLYGERWTERVIAEVLFPDML